MPSNDELREAADAVIKFNADWHYYYTPGQSIGNPVKVPWDLYQQAIKMAYHVKSTLATEQAGEQAITAERLVASGWNPRSNVSVFPSVAEAGWFSRIVEASSRSIEVTISRCGDSWSVAFNYWPDRRSHWPINLRLIDELNALLTALGIEVSQ